MTNTESLGTIEATNPVLTVAPPKEDSSLKQSKKRGEPEKGHNNTATVSVAKKEYGIRHQAESAGKSSLKM